MRSRSSRTPRFLQIVREEVRPWALARYARVEMHIARASAAHGCPHPYFAFQVLNRPTEIWWLNAYASRAEIESVPRAYAANTALMAALLPLSQAKKHLARTTLTAVLAWSHGAGWSPSAPFAVVAGGFVRAPGACFRQIRTAYCFVQARDLYAARRKAGRAGRQARVLKSNPRWSYPR